MDCVDIEQLTLHSQKSVRHFLEHRYDTLKEEAPHFSPIKTSGYIGNGQRGIEGLPYKCSRAIRQVSLAHTVIFS